MFKMLNVSAIIFMLTVAATLGGRASQYTRYNLQLQQARAVKVFGCNVTKIYVFDDSGFFSDAVRTIKCNETVLIKLLKKFLNHLMSIISFHHMSFHTIISDYTTK